MTEPIRRTAARSMIGCCHHNVVSLLTYAVHCGYITSIHPSIFICPTTFILQRVWKSE